MTNPNPITRARREEARRKALGGGDPRCLYCGEQDVACLELDHPAGRKRDPLFTQTVCRNCHRKLERNRDVAGLTKNGKHNVAETPHEEEKSYLLMLAADDEAQAAYHQARAQSLRRQAEKVDKIL